jgi:hypothetical protein
MRWFVNVARIGDEKFIVIYKIIFLPDLLQRQDFFKLIKLIK